MRVHSANLFPLVLLTLLAALTFWLERASQVGGIGYDKRRHDPDFVVDNFTLRRFNLDGSLQHSLSAKEMLHYPDDDSTTVTDPALIFFGNTSPTRLSAHKALISKDGKQVRLSDDVRVVREASAGNPELLVTTAEMVVYPDDEIARTSAPVSIVQGHSVLTGAGMEVDNRAHTYTLNGPTHGMIYRKDINPP
ncbi:MAG: LPS export ABC transporter periplasmic protein LptC [Betaproteobacteria bacterium]|nr:LPS export ABC transporter periplasmic protein LptC [Betaproteobacteria bacterium]